METAILAMSLAELNRSIYSYCFWCISHHKYIHIIVSGVNCTRNGGMISFSFTGKIWNLLTSSQLWMKNRWNIQNIILKFYLCLFHHHHRQHHDICRSFLVNGTSFLPSTTGVSHTILAWNTETLSQNEKFDDKLRFAARCPWCCVLSWVTWMRLLYEITGHFSKSTRAAFSACTLSIVRKIVSIVPFGSY